MEDLNEIKRTYFPKRSPSSSDSGSFWPRVSGKSKQRSPEDTANPPNTTVGNGAHVCRYTERCQYSGSNDHDHMMNITQYNYIFTVQTENVFLKITNWVECRMSEIGMNIDGVVDSWSILWLPYVIMFFFSSLINASFLLPPRYYYTHTNSCPPRNKFIL